MRTDKTLALALALVSLTVLALLLLAGLAMGRVVETTAKEANARIRLEKMVSKKHRLQSQKRIRELEKERDRWKFMDIEERVKAVADEVLAGEDGR